MKHLALWASTLLIGTAPLAALADPSNQASSQHDGQTDAETGHSTRTWLKEQVEGTHRGETEPYRAESAGKAYRAYADSIGAKDQKAPVSQVSTIKTN